MPEAQAAAPEPAKQSKPQWLGVSHSDCNKMLQHALTRDPTVKFMVDKMKEVHFLLLPGNCTGPRAYDCIVASMPTCVLEQEPLHFTNTIGLALLQPTHLACIQQAGCEIDQNFFRVESCDAQAGGGFRPPDGVRVVLRNSQGLCGYVCLFSPWMSSIWNIHLCR